jgi:Kdo2-lipid IVA lauroyltransferase/acyltransferase
MSRERSRVTDYLVYLIVRVVVCIIQILPYETSRRLARAFAWLAHKVDRRHRLVADDNLRHAFGTQLDDAARQRLVFEVYVHFCTMLIEILQLPRRLHPTTWRRYVELPGGDRIVTALLSGRPLLFVTGHFGNWEMAGYALGLFGFSTHAIARTLDNPHLDRFLRGFRERTGQYIIDKSGEFDKIQAVLGGAGVIATLADQDAGQRGQFVEFFGRPASTHKAVALLALEYKAPLLVIGVPRLGNPGRYHAIAADYIDPGDYAGRPDAVKAITERYTAALEQVVRLAPEQYFWLHRRWKHQPQARKGKKAAA